MAGNRLRLVSIIALYNTDGEVLLQHRTDDAPTLPNYWAFFGGGIEQSETPEEAVIRECKEELGYQLTRPRLLTVREFSHEAEDLKVYVFVEQYDGSKLTLGEGQAMGWYRPAETDGFLMSDYDRSIFRQVCSNFESRA
jgi:8-oxo-dGTP diphosphatase